MLRFCPQNSGIVITNDLPALNAAPFGRSGCISAIRLCRAVAFNCDNRSSLEGLFRGWGKSSDPLGKRHQLG